MRITIPILILGLGFPGVGKTADGESRMKVDPGIDLSITVLTVGLNLAPYLDKDEIAGPKCGLECDPLSLNALDRPVIDNRSKTAARASDILLASSVLAPYLIGAANVLADSPGDGWSGYGKDSLVIFETLSVNLLFNQVVKFTVRRPRPYVYDPKQDEKHRTGMEAGLSFYSGHSSTAFAAAVSGSYIFTLRHPDSNWVIPVWLGTCAMASATGILRVKAGKHFWSDVMVGAVAGSAFGLLIPFLHKSPASESSRASDGYRNVFSFGFAF